MLDFFKNLVHKFSLKDVCTAYVAPLTIGLGRIYNFESFKTQLLFLAVSQIPPSDPN